MTGLYDGIGDVITLTLFLLVYVPMIALLLLNQLGLYASLRTARRIFWQVVTFLLLVIITLLVLRSAPYVSVDWVLTFGIAVSLICLILALSKSRRSTERN